MDPLLPVLLRSLAVLVLVLAVVQGLGVVLCRESVKEDLRRQIARPVSIRWRPWASNRRQCGFWVMYDDFQDARHLATCHVEWYGRTVSWDSDVEVTARLRRPEGT